jgi:plasmid stabilization system protein ParE
MRLEFHPAAQAEVEQALAWYEERSVLAAAGFLRELSDVLQRAAEAPESYPRGAKAAGACGRVAAALGSFGAFHRGKGGTC